MAIITIECNNCGHDEETTSFEIDESQRVRQLSCHNAILIDALEKIQMMYIAEARMNDWSKCCELKQIAREALEKVRK